jgi:hypothetical protein
MSQPINEGGHAFPTLFIEPDYGSGYRGMTLRDYFAAAAINEVGWNNDINNSAAMAYKIADAMLKAREAK